MSQSTKTRTPVPTSATPAREVRPEIQALRALAVLAVVTNHLWPAVITGGYVGVDIFFVISGYLITSHLLRELESRGTIGLRSFWARRARRLLPASLLVLAVSAIAAIVFIPQNLWQLVMRQIAASALYVQNWILASDAQDYFASANSPSPVTHYWSLSAEEQFYVVWPLLILGLAWIAMRVSADRRRVITVGLAVAVVLSLAYSIYATATTPQAAYFITPVRAWEFGAGGLLALLPSTSRLVSTRFSPALRAGVSWGGWVAMLASIALLTEQSPFPGALALVPVLGCAAVIWAGGTGVRWSVDRAAALRPVQFIGDISYSLYLWHWPIIVLAPYVLDRAIGLKVRVAILVASIALAYLSKKFVEDPVRRARWLALPRRTLIGSVAGMVIVVVIAGTTWSGVQARYSAVLGELKTISLKSDTPCFGAAATAPGSGCASPHALTFTDSDLINSSNLGNDTKQGSACQQDRDIAAILSCSFGVPAASAKTHVALVGDSHAAHWTSAIDSIAEKYNWNVTMMTKSSCPASLDPTLEAGWYPAGASSCETWAKSVVDRIANDKSIDIVITSSISREYISSATSNPYDVAQQVAGYRAAWAKWTAAGKTVVVIGDVPQMNLGDIPTCVAATHATEDPCTSTRAVALSPDPLAIAAQEANNPAVIPVDLIPFFCDSRVCHSVIGGFVAYGDASHITSIFARTLAPYLYEQIAAGERATHRS